jgi:hypothetical protein
MLNASSEFLGLFEYELNAELVSFKNKLYYKHIHLKYIKIDKIPIKMAINQRLNEFYKTEWSAK